ncbi:RabGAP/TBC, partial [Piedraia hortae CBS 480.64]
MRRLHDAATSWKELQRYKSLDELRKTVRIGIDDLRSAYWKAFLLFQTVDISTWIQTLSSSRSAYDSLRVHFLSSKEASDPLSEVISELSVADESLRAEISQDVSRCMPENLYFRQPETQQMLTEILFVFAKLNPDVSYRQGMHELLAPVLWVVERDAIDLGLSSKLLGEDAVIKAMFDADYIEHDSFALFSQLMHSAKNFYEQTTSSGNENPMVIRSKRIVFTFLPQIDPELAFHLKKIDIAPQVFLMRWIRLLFGREFPFDDVLSMWDIIFAEDPSLEIVDHVCLVMLLRVRWELLECDYNSALALLLRYPEPVRNQAQGICIDAVYLRENMHPEAGGYLVLKYTDKPLRLANRPNTPPALQRNITMFSGSVVSTRKGRNLEAFAKDIYERGGKAVRNAVEEVNKKAQEIRDSAPLTLQGPEAVLANRRSGGRGAIAPQSQVAARIKALERRNKQLSKLLEGALNELWDFEKNDHSEDRAK